MNGSRQLLRNDVMMNDGMKNKERVYDLEERTAKFGEAVVEFCRSLPKNVITTPIIHQLIKSGTSMGANYCEADDAESKKDFCHKMGIAKKEARETKYWLRIIVVAESSCREKAQILWQEARELHLIFAASINSARLSHDSH